MYVFRTKHPPKAIIVVLSARMNVLAFQDQTPSQREIFFQICYCSLFSLLVCMYWPFQDQTPSQSEIFFLSCYCSLFCLLVCMYWPFRTKHPPKVKYFFKSVIVDCSLCSYQCIGLSGPNTLPK